MADTPKKAPAKKAPAKKAAPRKAAAKKAPAKKIAPVAPPAEVDEVDNVRELRPKGGRQAPPRRDKTSPKAIDVARRRGQALTLRLGGASYQQISDTLRPNLGGMAYGRDQAYRDVAQSIEQLTDIPAQHLRDETIARFDWALRAIAPDIQRGDLDAIDRLVRIETQRAKLLGLYNPVLLQVTGADGGPILIAPAIDRDKAIEDALEAVNAVIGGNATS